MGHNPAKTETGDVVTQLQRLPLQTIDEVTEALNGLPGIAGVYTWWLVNPKLLPIVPTTSHPVANARLLYLGIGPGSAKSIKRKLRDRFKDHANGNPGGSTLRLSLAALLWQEQGWKPIWTDRAKLSAEDNAALTDWMRKNLRIQWTELPEPWHLEPNLITCLSPPLNLDHNADHPFYVSMGEARFNFRQVARLGQRR